MCPKRTPETALLPSVEPLEASARQVGADLRQCLRDGATIHPAGEAREDPDALLKKYAPIAKVELFGAHLWLGSMRHDDYLNYMVSYVGLRDAKGRIRKVFPRIFYKDSSLVWRVASHFISTDDEHWIGKGDVRWEQRKDGEYMSSAEETTNLPYEVQHALDNISRLRPSKYDSLAVPAVLRRGGPSRTHPFSDFSKPRELAAKTYRVNGGKAIAYFKKAGVPESLTYAKGYEPDLKNGLIDSQESGSRLYGGAITKYRFYSKNREIQYQYVASPTHVFVNHPQTLTTELMSYGTRTIDVIADDDAFLPGFEYHFMDESTEPPTLYSQIPKGFAGVVGVPDPERADASPWLERLPSVIDFRREVVG